jgi:glycosyltransferase involved in cell wall biosynthesis
MNERLPSNTRINDFTKGASPGKRNPILSSHRIDKGGLIVCFSHLRWDFVFQRPHQILTRASEDYDVIYVEEPMFENSLYGSARVKTVAGGVQVVTPVLPVGTEADSIVEMQRRLLDQLLANIPHHTLIAWYYTPMALPFSAHLRPDVCVYDCMDELSGFKDPPARLIEREAQLFSTVDLVFTGGESLYQAKRNQHPRVYAFPSSIDASHFNKARARLEDPTDQKNIPRPRIGFFGVIDERMDLTLVAKTANRMPDCQFVMLGPVVKIDPEALPRASNLHWLGGKSYDDLPFYLAHWSAGWMPFALNESTRFISPTKTPEFLAAGLPVVSTAIADVVRPYGALELVGIANADDMADKLQIALGRKSDADWLKNVDGFLAGKSWDKTWDAMSAHIARLQVLNDTALMQRGA